MRNLFDDFMKELAERQRQAEAAARGEHPPAPQDPDEGEAPDVEREPADGADVPPVAGEGHPPPDRPDHGRSPGEDDAPAPLHRPHVVSGGRRTPPPGVPPRRRGPGGPDDGGSRRRSLRSLGPQVLLVVVVIILLSAVFLVGTGIQLVTDATWFKSVGYDAVFWTRIGAQAGLFALGLVVALVFLLLNIWLAGRLAPPPGTGAGDRFRAFIDRLGQSARTTGESQFRVRYDPFGDPRRRPSGDRDDDSPLGIRPVGPSLTSADLPDLRPLGIVVLVVLAILVALGTAGALSGSWETVALYLNRVPYAPGGAAPVVDPIFGRDISFYFFDLPFRGSCRRRSAGSCWLRCSSPSLAMSWRRSPGAGSRCRSASTWACWPACTCSPLRRATSWTSSSWSTARPVSRRVSATPTRRPASLPTTR
jgi:hypothetical protein